jgi:hypothetical protein
MNNPSALAPTQGPSQALSPSIVLAHKPPRDLTQDAFKKAPIPHLSHSCEGPQLVVRIPFLEPRVEDKRDTLYARFIELYWDKVSSNVFVKNNRFDEDLEDMRLQFEREMDVLDSEGDKNRFRLRLVQDCSPLFVKSLSQQNLKNKAVIALLGHNPDDAPSYVHFAQNLSEEEAKNLSSALEVFVQRKLSPHLQLCADVLNRFSSKTIVHNVVVNCFRGALFVDRYAPLLNRLEDQSLKNEICFELLGDARFNFTAYQFLLKTIEAQSDEDLARKDSLVECILLRHWLQPSAMQTFLPFIENPCLRACLIARCVWKHSLSQVLLDMIQQNISDEDLRYWVYTVLSPISTRGPESLEGLADLIRIKLSDTESKIDDYDKALSFIKNLLHCFHWLELGLLRDVFITFLETLSWDIQDDICYAIMGQISIDVGIRELVAASIKDPQAREESLNDIGQGVDRGRFSHTKGVFPNQEGSL